MFMTIVLKLKKKFVSQKKSYVNNYNPKIGYIGKIHM